MSYRLLTPLLFAAYLVLVGATGSAAASDHGFTGHVFKVGSASPALNKLEPCEGDDLDDAALENTPPGTLAPRLAVSISAPEAAFNTVPATSNHPIRAPPAILA